ncbi:hypothetical protein GX865_05395, partial [Candidatus Saccharibacteria bacterium]|nr:hypothetical protein [Candidatus Saccharibacteria bacterium]
AFDSKPKPPTGATGDLGDYLRPEDVTKGMTVIHQRFGTGTVQTVEKVAGDALISVLFESGSSKNMLLKQAKLKKT